MCKYVEAKENLDEIIDKWGYPWIEIRWLHIKDEEEAKDYLPENCFLREANLPEDEDYLLALII